MRWIPVLLSLFLGGCSVILPYSEDTLCSKGAEGGYCGRISDVYEKTLEEEGDAVLAPYELCASYPELCSEGR